MPKPGPKSRWTPRAVAASLAAALGLWALLAAVMIALGAAGVAERQPMAPTLASGLAAGLYLAGVWRFVPSLAVFLLGLLLWSLAAFALLAAAPDWMFGPPPM